MNRKQREEQEIEDKARDMGREYYHTKPDLMLCEVAREAMNHWAWKPAEIAFLEGYQEARKRHEEFLTEKSEKESDDDDQAQV
jgi:hypothetical protein